jgi:CRP-like cAMP-binding protein
LDNFLHTIKFIFEPEFDYKFQVKMKQITVKKGQIIQYKGDRNTKIYRVESGLLRSYSIDAKGKEHIFLFAPEGWVMADTMESNTPCELFIEALEDSVLYVQDKDFREVNPAIETLLKRIGVLQKRVIMLMSASALERYEHFVETYPEILQRVPQKMIASYLGITPEALSKVKNEKVKQK